MERISLNEEKLRKIIAEATERVLAEAEMDEGLWDNLKAGFKGAKAGYNTQKSIDANNNDYQRGGKLNNSWDYMDQRDPDAIEGKNGIRDMINQARQYETYAKKLREKAKSLMQYYKVSEKNLARFKGNDKRQFNYDDPLGAGSEVGSALRKKREENGISGLKRSPNLQGQFGNTDQYAASKGF